MLSGTKLKTAIIVMIMLSFGFCFLIYADKAQVKTITLSQLGGEEKINFCIDDASVENGIVFILGWAFEKGQSIETYDLRVALKEHDSDKAYVLPTEMLIRNEVTQAYNDGFNYDASGFLSRAYASRLGDSKI